MPSKQAAAESVVEGGRLLLGIDTCGPSGSVALGRLSEGRVEVLGQTELPGRSYAATLVSAVDDLLANAGARLGQIQAIVAVHGPGSFTGVRIGLSAVKGLAEPSAIPVVAVSRLAVLAEKSDVLWAALDAHRHEVFLRIAPKGGEPREVLAGASELAAIEPPSKIALCDEAAAELVRSAWPAVELIHSVAPTAADALQLALLRILARDFVDLARLDGHYLRRSDAEIFGDPAAWPVQRV
jgi:tRNA threonylcarbamoyladenosine biosynthesis protein TsaB